MPTELAKRLLGWYDAHARRLPWRNHPDPYAVWVSEIMLQQTQVETVIPYFQRWMERFPTLLSLAAASEQDVLALWEGLGYYSRARNLHKAAQIVAQDYGGELPAERETLKKLPGIGAYTAGAVASMAFGKDEPTLDGNIRRVLARIYDLRIPARSPEGERLLWGWAAENLPAGRAGDFNQALMDLGSAICTPRAPKCPECPVEALCQARQLGVQEERPILAPRPAVPHYIVTAAIIEQGEQVLIARRPTDGLLGGLWEFPGGKQDASETLPECLKREIWEELGAEVAVGEPFGVYYHGYTHFKVTLHAFFCRLAVGEPQALHHSELRWVGAGEMKDYPMGKIDRQIANRLAERAAKA